MGNKVTIPADLSGVTGEWLGQILSQRVRITSLRGVVEHGGGVLGQVARIRLSGGGSIVVKLSAPPGTRNYQFSRMLNLAEREYCFYREIAGSLPIRTARLLGSGYDGREQRCALVLEDLGTTNDTAGIFGISITRAYKVMEVAARLHTQFRFDRTKTPYLPWLPSASDPTNAISDLMVEGLPSFMDRFGGLISSRMVDTLQILAPIVDEIAAVGFAESTTLVHGDMKADNIIFTSDGHVGLIDWQMASIGEGVRDIAYFIGTSLREELIRQHAKRLLAHYEAQLESPRGNLWPSFRRNVLLTISATTVGLATLDVGTTAAERRREETIRRMFSLGEVCDVHSLVREHSGLPTN